MNKSLFAKGLMKMREFCLWVDRIDNEGIDLGNQYLDAASEALYMLLVDGDSDWDYDEWEGFSWILEFTGNKDFPAKYRNYERGGRTWDLSDPCALYDFLIDMNENHWYM